DRLSYAACRRSEIVRVVSASHGEYHAALRALSEREIKFRLRIEVQTLVSDAPDNSDYGQPLRIFSRIIEGDAFSQIVLIRPIFFCERIIDNDDAGSVGVVGLGEKTAAK